MTGGQQRRPSFDMTVDDTAFLIHELNTIDPAQQHTEHADDEDNYENEDITHNSSSIIRTQQQQQQQKSKSSTTIDIFLEIRLFFELAGVSTLISLSSVSSSILTASYIGRNFPIVYLSSFTLANLTGNLSTFALMSGLMSASDTLSPQAFSKKNYTEVGRIAIRGFFVCTILLLPINIILYFYLDYFLINYLKQNEEASIYAQQWYKIFSLSLPFSILYNCIWKFLTSQHIMKPLIIVSLISTLLVLPIGLNLFISIWGFIGSAYAYLTFQIIQTTLLLLYVWYKHPHHSQTWPVHYGNVIEFIKSSLEWYSMKEFLYLGTSFKRT
jgi:Na+-driven multidrug efflux pump